MLKNQQAKNLSYFNSFFIYTVKIELSKKEINELKKGDWLEIGQEFLNIDIVKDNLKKYRAKLFSDGDYFYIKTIDFINKKFKLNSDNNSFILKYNFSKKVFDGIVAIDKSPLNVIIVYNKREYAKADLYISDKIFLEIKEIL